MTRIHGKNKIAAVAIVCAFLISALLIPPTRAFANTPNLTASVLVPATGQLTAQGGAAIIDYSNTGEGYIMACYTGSTRSKLQITKSGGTTYTYDLHGYFEAFPLTGGSGTYTFNAFENVYGNQYALLTGESVDVVLNNDRLPFLYPNQYVNFNAGSATVQMGAALAAGITDPLQIVANVYNWVIGNIQYDNDKAAAAQAGTLTGYLPNVDAILESKKGICFDYASLMAAMLRSQNIPTRLQVGYVSGGVYHAWLSVYTDETGWINNIIYFDGTNWKLMDPTFASTANQSSDVMQFIGNGTNYSTVYTY